MRAAVAARVTYIVMGEFPNAKLAAMTTAANSTVTSQPSQLTGLQPQPNRLGPNQGRFVIIRPLAGLPFLDYPEHIRPSKLCCTRVTGEGVKGGR